VAGTAGPTACPCALRTRSAISAAVIPSAGGNDVFELESHDGQNLLRGNNGVALASALHRYLKEFCHADISYGCGHQLTLPGTLPAVPQKVRVDSPNKYRYAYNYCTHGYTMAWWDWPQWEKEIDFLALNGIKLAQAHWTACANQPTPNPSRPRAR
jgi:alpha-N-acetylglucosaminidase